MDTRWDFPGADSGHDALPRHHLVEAHFLSWLAYHPGPGAGVLLLAAPGWAGLTWEAVVGSEGQD